MPLDRRASVLPGVIHESDGRVLDLFAGSGTTLVAAQLEGFEAVGIEITEQYAAVTCERLHHL
ncbi:DNA modification methylase [Xanthomonas campestris]